MACFSGGSDPENHCYLMTKYRRKCQILKLHFAAFKIKMGEKVTFCPRELLDAFQSANQDGQIVMDEYVRGYNELTHFFETLGSVFGFINSDVVEKVTILKYYRNGETKEKYCTVKDMMEYEIEQGFPVSADGHPSASRTLLRLHRALAFASLFMKQLGEAEREDKCSTIAYDSYNETLAKFHPWLIQKGVGVATYTLGSCGSLIDKCRGEVESSQAQELLGEISKAMDAGYNETEALYTKNHLHELPKAFVK